MVEQSQSKSIQWFWQQYLHTLPDDHPHRAHAAPQAWSFGDSADMADRLGELVARGIKTATCCRYLGENLLADMKPSIILDGKGRPICVVEPTELTVRSFNDIDSQFAWDEGEGDRTLDDWRRGHWDYFTREGEQEGYEVSEHMLLKAERFRVVYRRHLRTRE